MRLQIDHLIGQKSLHLQPATKLGQGYVFTRFCDSVHWGSASVHAGIPPTREQTPWGADTTPGSRHPRADNLLEQCMLGDTGNKRAVCILLECNLVLKFFSLWDRANKRKFWIVSQKERNVHKIGSKSVNRPWVQLIVGINGPLGNRPENGTSEQEVFGLSWGAHEDPLYLCYITVSLENLTVNSEQWNRILLQSLDDKFYSNPCTIDSIVNLCTIDLYHRQHNYFVMCGQWTGCQTWNWTSPQSHSCPLYFQNTAAC